MKTRQEFLFDECVEFLSELKPDAMVADARRMTKFIELMIRELHELELLHDKI